MDNKKWLIILNPAAHSGQAGAAQPAIVAALDALGIDYTLCMTTHKGHALQLAKTAIAENGVRYIAAVGGDGTLHEVVNGAMLQTAVPTHLLTIAMLPLGTGNDWVRTHGIAADWRKAVQLLAHGRAFLHDIGAAHFLADGQPLTRYFINVAGMAYDGYVGAQMLTRPKVAWLPPALQYLELIFGCLFGYQPEHIAVNMPQQPTIAEPLYTVNIGICKYNGGGCIFVPHAAPDSGLLAVTVVRAMPVWRVLLSTPYFYNGKIGAHSRASIHKSKTVH